MNIKDWIIICLLIFGAIGCEKNQDPIPDFQVEPVIGHYSQNFHFDGSNSRDPESRVYELLFRWDFDGDGEWDTEWSHQSEQTHRYSHRGWYSAFMEVSDPQGNLVKSRRDINVSLLNLKSNLVDPRDGQTYKIVLIDSIWWMSQDFCYGKWLSMWERAMQTDNGVVERYGATDFEDLDRLTGYYNYGEAMNYNYQVKSQGICPPGWYIPTNDEWQSLVDHVGADRDPAIFLSVIGDEGVNLSYTGRRFYDWGQSRIDFAGLYWTSTGEFTPSPQRLSIFYYPKDTTELRPLSYTTADTIFFAYRDYYALPLRCVKKHQYD